jgi:hypothetical protein
MLKIIAKLRGIVNELNSTRTASTILIAKEALSLIRRRIQNEGKDAVGAQLGDYSDNPLPAFFFYGKSINASGENAVRRAVKEGKGISYKDFRSANNLPTDKVVLTFSGAMWREMDVKIISDNLTNSTAQIEPKTERSRKVAAYNSERYGDILALSKEEKEQLNLANSQRLRKVLLKFLK